MAPQSQRRTPTRTVLGAGPWRGVKDSRDPYDDTPNLLVDATNAYIPDPAGGSGLYARRGFSLQNRTSGLAGRGQGVYSHVALNGTVTNVLCAGGHLYRADAGLSIYVDVTPLSGVTISPVATRVYFISFADSLIISDGVNPPWIAGDLTAAHFTGQYIDFDGMGIDWSAFGQPVEYAGSLFFILNRVGGVYARTTITWSAPGDPTSGYSQVDFDYVWTLEQTGSTPIYALFGTNVALFYWRDKSIGAIAGIPGPDLQQTHTADAIAQNVGTLQSATIRQFGNTIFFCDAQGRPWAFPLGGALEPIWLNMRASVESSTYQYPNATAQVACAVIEPTLNVYIAAIWSPVPGSPNPPVEMFVFDCKTLAFLGRWFIKTGTTIEAMGILNDNAGSGSLVIIGNDPAPGGNGTALATENGFGLTTESGQILGTYDQNATRTGIVWVMNGLIGDGMPIEEEDGTFMLTEDGQNILTENTIVSWKDDGVPPLRSATTQRLGYASDTVWNTDLGTVITLSPAPVDVRITTTTSAAALQGTPSPSASDDETYRLVVGSNVQGRGPTVYVSPTTAEDQWALESVSLVGIPSTASAIEP